MGLRAGLSATCGATVLTGLALFPPNLPGQKQKGSCELRYTVEANKALRLREEEQREEAD